MRKLENKKQQKLTSLLDTAFNLFTSQGFSKTSISEISQKAGIAKGTFYLYFKDKYDIRNHLISHESSKLFRNAVTRLNSSDISFDSFEDSLLFIINDVIDQLSENQALLTFISKNLSWGIFKEALTTKVAEEDINFKDVYYDIVNNQASDIKEPEIMLFLIIELVSSTCYSAILYKEPADMETIKPYLFNAIKAIIDNHRKA